MSNNDTRYYSGLSLADMLGHSPLSDDEIVTLRRRAWTEQGVFIIRPSDIRLTTEEALLLRDIAERIYGGLQS